MKCRPIPNFRKQYVISKNGDVFRRLGDGFSSLSPATNDDGYLTVILHKNGKPHFKYIHDLVANTYLDGINDKGIVNHKDGDKENNNVENLEFVDAQENTKHAYEKGLAKGARGEINGMSKITDKQVDKIRKSKESGTKLADLYGITPAAVSLIRNYKRR